MKEHLLPNQIRRQENRRILWGRDGKAFNMNGQPRVPEKPKIPTNQADQTIFKKK